MACSVLLALSPPASPPCRRQAGVACLLGSVLALSGLFGMDGGTRAVLPLVGAGWLAPRVAVSMFAAKLLGLGLGQRL